jgi:hypothetical protein
MKSRFSGIAAIAALGALSLMSIGFASAAPVCFTPTWTSTPNSGSANITLTAICTPDIGYAINSISGYAWQKNNTPISGTGIVNTDTLTDGATATYKVQATENATNVNTSPQTQQSNTMPVTVYASLPSCSLALFGGGASTTISSGSVTLVPTCTGVSVSTPIEWYANTADNPIPDPVGGVITPPSGKTSYFVVGTNGYGIAASNNVDVQP